MILILQGDDAHPALKSARRLRARVFRDKLGWPVSVDADGEERDQFDADAAHLIVWDGSEALGYARLLPTTGTTMLCSVFGKAFPAASSLTAPSIWEVTRLCSCDRHAARLLLIELGRLGLSKGIETYLGVMDHRVVTAYRRLGAVVDIVEEGAGGLIVGAFPVSKDILAIIEARQ